METRDKYGWTPLYTAARYGQEGIARLLLDRNADLETRDNNGKTVLEFAQQYGNRAVIQLLQEGRLKYQYIK